MDYETYKTKRLAGFSPEEAFEGNDNFSAAETIGNIPASAGRFLGGIGSALLHPIRTVKALGGLGAGAVEKIIPGEQKEEVYFDSLADFYKQRYGGGEKILQTIEKDPIGFLADVSTILSAGGAIASKIGTISKLNTVAKTGQVVSKVGDVVNPLSTVGVIGKPLKDLFPKAASLMEKSSWRMTKTKEGGLLTKMSDDAIEGASLITKNKLNDVANFITKQKITGSPLGRYAKATEIYEKTEDVLDGFFDSIAKGHGVKKTNIVRSLGGLKGAYKGTRDSAAISKQIDSAINVIKKDFPNEIIPYKDLNRFKRTTFANAYNKAGDKVLDDIEHAIGDTVRGHLDEGLRGLKIAGKSYEEFNHNYGLLIEGRKILKSAIGKRQLSAVSESLLGGMIGYVLGGGGFSGGAGAFGGAVLGKTFFENLPITRLRSILGAGAQKIGELKIPEIVSKAKIPITGIERIQEAIISK